MGVTWRIGGVYKANAETVYNEINSIGNVVTPQAVVDYAKVNKNSELHKCFEWDDKKAANSYRLQQAGNIIRMLVVKDEKEESPAPTVRALVLGSGKQSEYAPIHVVVSNPDGYERLRRQAWDEMRAFIKKYENIVELKELIDEIRKIIA